MENFKLSDSMIKAIDGRVKEMLNNPDIRTILKPMSTDEAKDWLFWAAVQTLLGKPE